MRKITLKFGAALIFCILAFGSPNFAVNTTTGMSAIQFESAPQYTQSLNVDTDSVIHNKDVPQKSTSTTPQTSILKHNASEKTSQSTSNRYLTLLLLLLWLVI